MILGGIRESKKRKFRSPSPKGSAEFETGVASLPLETGKPGLLIAWRWKWKEGMDSFHPSTINELHRCRRAYAIGGNPACKRFATSLGLPTVIWSWCCKPAESDQLRQVNTEGFDVVWGWFTT